MKADFNSERWFSDLKDLADEFYNTSDKRFVTYDRKSIDRIKAAYFTRLRLLKSEHDKRNNLFTYALAHMVYFVEQNFTK